MPIDRRTLIKLAAVAPCVTSGSLLGSQSAAASSLETDIRLSAGLLGLPGFVAGVVKHGKLSLVQAEGFADLESHTPMRRDHIFSVASLTKTFTAVMLMQYAEEKKISLDDYVLDYPYLSVGFTADRLIDPNLKLKHVLSHTSEGTPGDTFIYNGSRYNFLYGVLEKVSGNTNHFHAVAQEFARRIEKRLGLTSTLAGYPVEKTDERISRIATPYFLDSKHQTATKDTGASRGTTLYPGTGLLSNVDDLAKYMTALDENVLISSESYAHLTTPFILNGGRRSTHGLGWSTQRIGGHAVHWHYGYDDSCAALLVRIPEKKTSFIFLSNTGTASAPFLLGYGNLLTSPFAVAFLDSELPGVLTTTDKDFSRMYLVRYTDASFGRDRGEAKTLLTKLRSTAPARFQQSDRATISLLSKLSDPDFSREMDSLASAYRQARDFHPDISLAIAEYYSKIGERDKSIEFLRHAADSIGYDEQGSTREACVRLGAELLGTGTSKEGRKYIWMGARYAQVRAPQSVERIVGLLKR